MEKRMYKGTDKNLQCRGFQYEIGQKYKEKKADLCVCGFHAYEAPLDTLRAYSPGEEAHYFEVELDANKQRTCEDSQRVGKHIKIIKEIGICGLLKAHFQYVERHIKTFIGDEYTESAVLGDYGKVTAGKNGRAVTGKGGMATTGDHGTAVSGEYGIATAGMRGMAMVNRQGAAIASVGGIAVAGDNGISQVNNQGLAVTGRNGAATAGYQGMAVTDNWGKAATGK